jgi:glutamine amidotransferase
MCELFALSGSIATTTSLSMERLALRGDRAGHLSDGWGIGFYDGPDVRLFREPEAAGDSAWVRFIGEQRIRSHLVMSHLRHATQGEVSLRNTQPFARELGGRMHLFAHNGRLPGIEERLGGQDQRHAPIGSSDSEFAFCVLLDRLTPLWTSSAPTLQSRLAVVSALARELRGLGPANFLYADGEFLFAHGHRRLQPDGSTAAPGLHVLHRECATDPDALAAAGVEIGHPQAVTLFASVPLTLDDWRPLYEGEIVVTRSGIVVTSDG